MKKIIEDSYHYDNITSTTSYSNSSTSLHKRSYSPITFIICIVLIFLLCISLYRTAAGLGNITFSGLLSYLQNMPNFSLPFTFADFIISDSWGVFDFLRIAINGFTGFLSLILYLATSVVQLIHFVIYSLGFFFV